jgi:glycerol uptake facilitator-like aquaporin
MLERLAERMRMTGFGLAFRRVVAEAVGTALVVCAIVGSGIMGSLLDGGNNGLTMLAVSVVTGCVFICAISAFGRVSGGHFNPAITISVALRGGIDWIEVPGYVAAQFAGAIGGVAIGNSMFGMPVFFQSGRALSGSNVMLAEFVATFGLLATIWGCVRLRNANVPFAVGAYMAAATWFTSSTAFVNPAAALARSLSNTPTGIRPSDALVFVALEIGGAVAATLLFAWMMPESRSVASAVLVPRDGIEPPLTFQEASLVDAMHASSQLVEGNRVDYAAVGHEKRTAVDNG